MSIRTIFVGLLSGSLLAGCATPPLAELEDAWASYSSAKADPEVAANAPVALYEAEKTLRGADKAWEDDDRAEAVHQAYLAQKRVEIARAVAAQRQAEQEAENLNAERQKVLLSARTREITALEEKLAALGAKQTERGAVVTLGDVLFDFNRAELKPGAQQNLYRLVSFLRENQDRELLVEGHTDNVGSDSYNLELSQRRADTVRFFMLQNGVASERIIARGFGKTYPVAANDSPGGRQLNRRVEVVILDPGERAHEAARTRMPAPASMQ
jgi:outer membrane protein OmpA-like peptidoglycan-associated protein